MSAFYVPAALLTAILLASMWSGAYMQRLTHRWTDEVDAVTELLRREQWDEAEERLDSLYRDWKSRTAMLHMILEHQDLDEAEKLFSGAAAACRERDSAELGIHLGQLGTQLRFLAETQQANLKNVF